MQFENLQEPVDGNDETDVLGWETDCSQHQDHGDETGTRHAGCTHAGKGRRQTENQQQRFELGWLANEHE